MAERLRFHLDEHMPKAVAEGLRRRGIDVTTTPESAPMSEPDARQLAFAAAAGRVLVTHDSDFIALHRSGVQHWGIAYCHRQNCNVGDLLRGLVLLWEVLSPGDMRNHLEFL